MAQADRHSFSKTDAALGEQLMSLLEGPRTGSAWGWEAGTPGVSAIDLTGSRGRRDQALTPAPQIRPENKEPG